MARNYEGDLVRITVEGAGDVASRFSRAERALQDEVIAVLRELDAEAEKVLREAAPVDTEQLRDKIRGRFYFQASAPSVTIEAADVIGHGGDPRSYVDVTRRGHRSSRIWPRGKALKVHIQGHRSPHIYVFRAWVSGVGWPHPDTARAMIRQGAEWPVIRSIHRQHDWVEDAMPEIDRLVADAEQRLARRVEAVIR